MNACWCGGTEFEAFREGYERCTDCGSLVYRGDLGTLIGPDDSGFYGRAYWTERQAALHHPPIEVRARKELVERNLAWLRSLLAYCAPPARILELGCGHGSFVSLLQAAGYQAAGLDISPWVVAFARRTFGIRVYQGQIEEQDIEAGSLDCIVLMDVLEHLADPVQTLQHCLALLKPAGLLVIQTPRYPGGSFADLAAAGAPFLKMLLPVEHIHLFSQEAIIRLLGELGLEHVAFEPAFFPYDMFLFAGRRPLRRAPGQANSAVLEADPARRPVLGLLDLFEQNQKLAKRFSEADRDRTERLKQIQDFSARLRLSEADRAARLEQVQDLTRQLQEIEKVLLNRHRQVLELTEQFQKSDADRAARLEQVQNLTRQLQKAEQDRAARFEQVQDLTWQLQEAEQDRAARHRQVRELTQQVQKTEADRAARLEQLQDLTLQLQEAEQDRAARQSQVLELTDLLHESEADRAARFDQIQTLTAQLKVSEADRQARFDQIQELTFHIRSLEGTTDQSSRQTKTIMAIDLVPLRPGGVNGGAGVLAHFLLENLPELGNEFEFVLLTAPWNHEDLSRYARRGVSLQTAYRAGETRPQTNRPILSRVAEKLLGLLESVRRRLPPDMVRILLPVGRYLQGLFSLNGRTRGLSAKARVRANLPEPIASQVDILFCPFTAVTHARPGMKVISFVHDLQHRVYPQFFSSEQIIERDAFFIDMAARADLILCNSNYTRQNLHEFFPQTRDIPTKVIPVSIHTRLKSLEPAPDAMDRLGLKAQRYLFYPANFWPHKNHQILLTAFGMFAARNPDSDLCLVFTGALSDAAGELQAAAQKMGLAGRVHFLSYLPDQDLAALFQNCLALIYPSLFEGFGIPLLEAFLFGKPVLCSRSASLPEIAGDAAIYFDPRKPEEITTAIESFLADPALADSLAGRAAARLAQFAPAKMWAAYRQAFHQPGLELDSPK